MDGFHYIDIYLYEIKYPITNTFPFQHAFSILFHFCCCCCCYVYRNGSFFECRKIVWCFSRWLTILWMGGEGGSLYIFFSYSKHHAANRKRTIADASSAFCCYIMSAYCQKKNGILMCIRTFVHRIFFFIWETFLRYTFMYMDTLHTPNLYISWSLYIKLHEYGRAKLEFRRRKNINFFC